MRTEDEIKIYKYPEDFVDNILCGNCVELIKFIPDKKIDCIITDPPYGLNKNGIKNDKDLSFLDNVLPDCSRVLKDDSFFITFFLTSSLFKNLKNAL